jgi:hypothetical protein
MVTPALLINMVALLLAILGLVIGGVVLLSIEHADAIIIGLHEVALSLAVILMVCTSLLRPNV